MFKLRANNGGINELAREGINVTRPAQKGAERTRGEWDVQESSTPNFAVIIKYIQNSSS